LGRTNWNGEKFAIYLEEKDIVVEVNLFRSNNGGLFGDAYGRFVSNTGYTTQRYFNVGEWFILDNNKVRNASEFNLLKKNQFFEGAYRGVA